MPSIDLKSAIGFSDMRGKQKILSLPREHPGVTPGSGNDKTGWNKIVNMLQLVNINIF